MPGVTWSSGEDSGESIGGKGKRKRDHREGSGEDTGCWKKKGLGEVREDSGSSWQHLLRDS